MLPCTLVMNYILSSAGWVNYVFTAPADGSISLCWDNSYSYFNKYNEEWDELCNRKTVKIEMYMMNEDVPSNMDIVYDSSYGSLKLQVRIIYFY